MKRSPSWWDVLVSEVLFFPPSVCVGFFLYTSCSSSFVFSFFSFHHLPLLLVNSFATMSLIFCYAELLFIKKLLVPVHCLLLFTFTASLYFCKIHIDLQCDVEVDFVCFFFLLPSQVHSMYRFAFIRLLFSSSSCHSPFRSIKNLWMNQRLQEK